MEEFEKGLPEKYKTRFTIRDKHTWEQVVQEVQIAEMRYVKKGSEGPFGKLRGYFRVIAGKTSSLESWLELVPSQSEYTSVLFGGLKLIIRVGRRMPLG